MGIENRYIGLIHWPRLWVDASPSCLKCDPSSCTFDLKKLRDEVWSTIINNEISIKVYRDGTFLFDLQSYSKGELSPVENSPPLSQSMESIINRDEQRCELFNTFLYCLYTTIQSKQRRTVEKLLLRPKSLVSESGGVINSKQDTLTSQLASACYENTYSSNLPKCMDFRVSLHSADCVAIDTLTATGSLFSQVLDSAKSEELIRLCSLQLHAYENAEQHQNRYALAQTFMVSEFIVGEKYNGNSRHGFFKKIKKLCSQGCSLSICKLCKENLGGSEDKCLSGNLGKSDIENGNICLNRVRLHRNKWIHDHDAIQANAAEEAIRVSEKLIQIYYGIDFFANLNKSARTW